MKIAIINMACEAARWAAVAQEFGAVGLQAQRHEAVSGHALLAQGQTHRYCEELNRRHYHRPLRPGEIGCYASHMALWQQFLDSTEPLLAVFEDDIAIAPELPRVLATIERLPQDWDLIKLIGRSRENIAKRHTFFGETELIQYRRIPSLTGAYVVTRRGAEKLLSNRQRYGRPVDVDMRYWWECDLRVYGVQPYPVRAAASSQLTTIEGRRVRCDARMRLHRLFLQAEYTWLNYRMGLHTPPAQALQPIERRLQPR
jgi:glycosyl transferase family 25